jgi:alkylation response protein AidB-like acyl-CoA dehydrogenase
VNASADATTEPTADDLIQRARSLSTLLAEEAEEAERQRKPSDRVIRALEEADFFRLMVPRAYGGVELDLDTYVDVGLALAEGDASHAWVATFYIEHNWMLCQFPEVFQRELYRDRSYVLAPGMVAPAGQAEKVPGGYRLSGRWSWATGVMHADWAIVGSRVEDEALDGFAFMAVPLEQGKVEDVWFIDGMSATGSNDVIFEDVVVPPERAVSMPAMTEGRAHGSRLHPSPLHQTPMLVILALAASMPALGQVTARLRDFRQGLLERSRMGIGSKQAERPALQARLGRLELERHQLELLMRDVVASAMELRNEASLVDRGRWMASLSHVVQTSRRILADIAEASGASAHKAGHPLQRSVRDVNVLSCHVAFDDDMRREMYGRLLLGLPTIPALL